MSVRWTEDDLKRIQGKLRMQMHNPLDPVPSKYRNKRASFQGMKFDSEHELKVYKDFKMLETAGEIRAVVRQVSLPLPGSKRRMRLDFMVVESNGRIRWIDAKGFPTPLWECKRDQIQQAYGLTIETI